VSNGNNRDPVFSNPLPDMAISNQTTLVLIVLLLFIFCLFLLARDWNRREKQISELTRRVRDLEKASPMRLPYKSFEEILNGMAALEILEREADFKQDVIKNAKAHFTNAMATGTKREAKTK
jgi:hypothetical protein